LDCGYLAREQFEKLETDWHSVTAMLARMIDRAADFCKYDSDTDYRGMVAEDPANWPLDHDDPDLTAS
jgi:hypothetical protein